MSLNLFFFFFFTEFSITIVHRIKNSKKNNNNNNNLEGSAQLPRSKKKRNVRRDDQLVNMYDG